MGFAKLAAAILNEIRCNLSIIDSTAPAEKKGAALIYLLSHDQRFCRAVGKLAFRPARPAGNQPAVVPEVVELAAPPAEVKTRQATAKPETLNQPTITAPPRTIEVPKETPETRRNRLVSILSSFLAGKQIEFQKTRYFLASVMNSGVEISGEQWQTIFAALKKVTEIGRSYLLDSGTAPMLFAAAPIEMVDDYVFGQDGAMVQTMAEITERPEEEEMPAWLVAKCWILVSGLKRLSAGMGDFEIARTETFMRAIGKIRGPEKLAVEIKQLLPDKTIQPATERVGNGGARILGDLMSVVKGNGKSVQIDPAETARLAETADNAKNRAVAFAAAAKQTVN